MTSLLVYICKVRVRCEDQVGEGGSGAGVEGPANGDTQRRWEKVQGRKLDRRKELQSGVWVCLTE